MNKEFSTGISDLTALRQAVSRAYCQDEILCVEKLVKILRAANIDLAAVGQHATSLVTGVRRARQDAGSVDNLMQEFSLSSEEGVALMCLSEALIRIPDSATRDKLIRDKLSKGDWRSHLGSSNSLFANAATWGLMITGQLLATHDQLGLEGALTKLLAYGSKPLIRRGVEFVMTLLGKQFVLGETISQALSRSTDNRNAGYTYSFDMLGEAALTTEDAERYTLAYESAIHAIGKAAAGLGTVQGNGISVKLSALHPRYCRSQRERVFDELYPRLLALMQLAYEYNIGLSIDAEEADRLELSLELIDRLLNEPALADWSGLGVVVQAYQKRALPVLEYLIQLARSRNRYIMVRLVKGAYWDSEIKRAQVAGLAGYPVFTRKAHTDLSFLVCAHQMLSASENIYAQFATHNAQTLASVAAMATRLKVSEFEFQCLHGMGESLYDGLVSSKTNRCRIYAPVGRHDTLLPYLVRRMLENGANSSFVNKIVDKRISIAALVVDPLTQTEATGVTPHPNVVLPRDIYGSSRANSLGFDLSNEISLKFLGSMLEKYKNKYWHARPMLAEGESVAGKVIEIRNPANRSDTVGSVLDAQPADIAQAISAAASYAKNWSCTSVSVRAHYLRLAADLFESDTPIFVSLCIREAGKTWANALAEIRECVDFCRYYATQIERLPQPENVLGVAVCISPWNFPLAIFVGQVSAALAAGYTVLAKPAEQTPLIAAEAVRLLHQAGIPRDALQLLPGPGETVGAALTADNRTSAVIFTGSLEVAQIINRTLAAHPAALPEALLIAETGGQNAMIVDSSAHLEQAVQDILVSAFDSAGQRCSALRVLYLQEDIADKTLNMLRGAMLQLKIGNPETLSADVGPVIDEAARHNLLQHIDEMRNNGYRVFQCALPPECQGGFFVPPTLIEIDRIEQLSKEVFGPVVHALRFKADKIDQIVQAINNTGYRLTFGIHSRIEETIGRVTKNIRAGNQYVNRNIVGAVVGVQPFGGGGKSGTGPKAGGPFSIPRLLGLSTIDLTKFDVCFEHSNDPCCKVRGDIEALANVARRLSLPEIESICTDYVENIQHCCYAALPGPTGESNILKLLGHGVVLCISSDQQEILKQIIAVVATGNVPALERSSFSDNLLPILPATIRTKIQCVEHWSSASPFAILFSGSPQDLSAWRLKASALGGEIIPVITVNAASNGYPLHRLLREQVISNNTAAAGGDTALMALAD